MGGQGRKGWDSGRGSNLCSPTCWLRDFGSDVRPLKDASHTGSFPGHNHSALRVATRSLSPPHPSQPPTHSQKTFTPFSCFSHSIQVSNHPLPVRSVDPGLAPAPSPICCVSVSNADPLVWVLPSVKWAQQKPPRGWEERGPHVEAPGTGCPAPGSHCRGHDEALAAPARLQPRGSFRGMLSSPPSSGGPRAISAMFAVSDPQFGLTKAGLKG